MLGYITIIALAPKAQKENNTELSKLLFKIAAVLIAVLIAFTLINKFSSNGKCTIKEDGRVCGDEATHGDMCEYHYNMFRDLLRDIEDRWNNLS